MNLSITLVVNVVLNYGLKPLWRTKVPQKWEFPLRNQNVTVRTKPRGIDKEAVMAAPIADLGFEGIEGSLNLRWSNDPC